MLSYHTAVWLKKENNFDLRIAFIAGLVASTGCLATTEYPQVSLAYRSQPGVERVSGAESIKVNVMGKDVRPNKDWVCARAGYTIGDELRAVEKIESVTPPAGLVSSAIKAELTQRGFDIDYKGIPVVANVVTFLCYSGNRLSTIDAEIEIDLLVYRAGRPPIGQEFFHKYVKGEYHDGDPLRLWNGKNAKMVLEAALDDAMKRLFRDRRFVDVLLNPALQAQPVTGKQSPPPPMLYSPN